MSTTEFTLDYHEIEGPMTITYRYSRPEPEVGLMGHSVTIEKITADGKNWDIDKDFDSDEQDEIFNHIYNELGL
jgi:hypothetical protein